MNAKTESTTIHATRIPYADTGYFTKIVTDYLQDSSDLKPFFHRPPQLSSFAGQMAEKTASYKHRAVLSKALQRQYDNAGLKTKVPALLAKSETFTVTTGHQVVLFTGPLYFFYKIITAVKTCEALATAHPAAHFVPVFWMATEDHDFDEANHFYLSTGQAASKISWETDQKGAVGRMTTEGVHHLAKVLEDQLGLGYHAGELIKLFKEAYGQHPLIADATRYLVHKLFGHLGVIAIDGDDPVLKVLAIPAFSHELSGGLSAKAMEATDASLSNKYNLQVHPREINLFYLDTQLRERIVKEGDTYGVVNTDMRFSESEIFDLLKSNPERFSPNVILRGLYQEIILPNLAYIGGGGELAYWFQLKGVFEAFEVPFPILMLRNSALIIPSDAKAKMDGLGISKADLFLSEIDLENKLVRRDTSGTLNLEDMARDVREAFGQMELRMRAIDPTLNRSARSAAARADHIVGSLERKMLRAARKNQDVTLYRLGKLRDQLFPRGGLQERNENFSGFYLKYGAEFIDFLVAHFDPFEPSFTILEEVS